MKKLLTLMLVLCLVLAVAGCDAVPVQPEAEAPQEPAPDTGTFLPDEQLQSAADQAQPQTPEETTEEEPELGGNVGTAESYWYESDSGSGQYTDEVGNDLSYSYAVPAFNLDSADASAMNEEIEQICGTVIKEMKDAEANKYSLMYTSVSYEAYQNGDIVSLLLILNTDIEVVEYHALNLNVVTGERASGAEMVRYAGMTEDQFVEAAQTATEDKFMELYDGLQDQVDYFDEQYAKTMSADVFSLAAPMYLNGEGKICIIARIYALAGASYYDHLLTLG